MSNQNPPSWIGVNEAAALVGKSVSTVRRLIPEIEAAAPESIRREPVEGKGGEKVLFSREYLLERFRVSEPERPEPGANERREEGKGFPEVVEILERQLVAKDRQIESLQRDAEAKTRQIEEVTDSLQKFAAINAGLQNKLLQLTERAGERPAPEPGASESGAGRLSSPGYFVAVAVGVSLIAMLLLYLLLF